MKKGDDFISIHDLSTEEVWQLLDLAADLKQNKSRHSSSLFTRQNLGHDF